MHTLATIDFKIAYFRIKVNVCESVLVVLVRKMLFDLVQVACPSSPSDNAWAPTNAAAVWILILLAMLSLGSFCLH